MVKPYVLHDESMADDMRRFGTRVFGTVPVILMVQNTRGIPAYSGRRDVVNFLSKDPLSAIPWCEYLRS